MRKYGHLSLLEREKLYALITAGWSIRRIGLKLGRPHSTLSRELKRNTMYGKKYLPSLAEKRAIRVSNRQRCQASLKTPQVFLYVREHLRLGWSPEAIAGRLKLDIPGESLGVETIYRYVYQRRNTKAKLWQYLVNHRKHRRKENGRKVKSLKILNRTFVDNRAKYISKRKQIGHWETDLMEGKRADVVTVSVTVERVTRVTTLSKMGSKKASEKVQVLQKRLGTLQTGVVRTLTTDNGSENSYHQEIASSLNIKMYFCHPYHSWEKGTVENTIGRIRRFLPKGRSLDNLTEDKLQKIEWMLNTTPRKCLGYLTPYETMEKLTGKLKNTATS